MTYMSGSSSDPDLDRLNPRPAQPWVGALHPVRVLPRALTKETTTPAPFTGQELRSERRPHPQFVPSRLEGGAKVESGEHLPERLLRQEGVINVHLRP
jgi:hypothetical protein